MTEQAGVTNYLNTLIFCIVAKGVTVLMLVFLLFKWGQRLAYLILTVEICLIIIIIYSLWRISDYEKRARKDRADNLKAVAQINSCPDYFTKNESVANADGSVSTVCNKNYNTPDAKFSYSFAGDDINLSDTLQHFPTLDVFCNSIASDEKYSHIAWTDAKSKCFDVIGH